MKNTTIQPLIHRIGESLLVILPAAVGLLVAPEEKWTLQARTLCAMVGALLGVFVVWAKWSYEKIKEMERNPERIKKNYSFDNTSGIYIHKDAGDRVCGSCIESGVESKLHSRSQDKENIQWTCRVKDCGSGFVEKQNQAG